jgi:hypothetical protein
LYHSFLRFHEEEYKIAMAQSAKIGEVSGEESARYGTVFQFWLHFLATVKKNFYCILENISFLPFLPSGGGEG